ncbi:MAG: transposase [Gammaproteobacteria bacterium]|nr:transposase [Gammaproteobacteria bacterium]
MTTMKPSDTIDAILPTALWQYCAVHFMRNAHDHVSRQTDPACLAELKRMWSFTDMAHTRHELRLWVQRWGDEPARSDYKKRRRNRR